MDIDFLPVDLLRWDQLGGDLFVVCLWSDIRPLRGAAGLLDWRLNGKLSSWIREGRMSGAVGEKTLVPTTRVPWRTVLVLGVGASPAFSEDTFHAALARTFETMQGLNLRTVAMALPGRDADRITPERALELLRALAGDNSPATRFTVLDVPIAIRAVNGPTAAPRPSAATPMGTPSPCP